MSRQCNKCDLWFTKEEQLRSQQCIRCGSFDSALATCRACEKSGLHAPARQFKASMAALVEHMPVDTTHGEIFPKDLLPLIEDYMRVEACKKCGGSGRDYWREGGGWHPEDAWRNSVVFFQSAPDPSKICQLNRRCEACWEAGTTWERDDWDLEEVSDLPTFKF